MNETHKQKIARTIFFLLIVKPIHCTFYAIGVSVCDISRTNSLDPIECAVWFDGSHLNFFFLAGSTITGAVVYFFFCPTQRSIDRMLVSYVFGMLLLAPRGATLMIQCHCQPVSFAVVVCCLQPSSLSIFFFSFNYLRSAYLIRSHCLWIFITMNCLCDAKKHQALIFFSVHRVKCRSSSIDCVGRKGKYVIMCKWSKLQVYRAINCFKIRWPNIVSAFKTLSNYIVTILMWIIRTNRQHSSDSLNQTNGLDLFGFFFFLTHASFFLSFLLIPN